MPASGVHPFSLATTPPPSATSTTKDEWSRHRIVRVANNRRITHARSSAWRLRPAFDGLPRRRRRLSTDASGAGAVPKRGRSENEKGGQGHCRFWGGDDVAGPGAAIRCLPGRRVLVEEQQSERATDSSHDCRTQGDLRSGRLVETPQPVPEKERRWWKKWPHDDRNQADREHPAGHGDKEEGMPSTVADRCQHPAKEERCRERDVAEEVVGLAGLTRRSWIRGRGRGLQALSR